MYLCTNCDLLVSKPTLISEGHYGYAYAVCPECHSELEEAHKCDACGEYKADIELDDGLCKNCISDIKKDFYDFLHDTASSHNISIDRALDLFVDFIERYDG